MGQNFPCHRVKAKELKTEIWHIFIFTVVSFADAVLLSFPPLHHQIFLNGSGLDTNESSRHQFFLYHVFIQCSQISHQWLSSKSTGCRGSSFTSGIPGAFDERKREGLHQTGATRASALFLATFSQLRLILQGAVQISPALGVRASGPVCWPAASLILRGLAICKYPQPATQEQLLTSKCLNHWSPISINMLSFVPSTSLMAYKLAQFITRGNPGMAFSISQH